MMNNRPHDENRLMEVQHSDKLYGQNTLRIENLIKIFTEENAIEKENPFLETDMPFNQACKVVLITCIESLLFQRKVNITTL